MPVFPTLTFQASLTAGPKAPPQWTNLTDFARTLSTRRGRSYELDQTQTGSLDTELKNQDRRFDPTNQPVLVNKCTNPSFEVDLTGWVFGADFTSTTKSADFAMFGASSLKLVRTTGANNYVYIAPGAGFYLAGYAYTFSFYARRADGAPVTSADIPGSFMENVQTGVPTFHSQGDGWYRCVCGTRICTAPGSRTTGFYVGDNRTVYVDGMQIEQSDGATHYCDGSLDNCSWVGTAGLSASNRGGPYYGYLLPMRKVQLLATWDGITYPIFTGYAEGWGQNWPNPNADFAQVAATDMFEILATAKITTAYSQERTDQRIDHALTAASFTAGLSWLLGTSELGVSTRLGPYGDRALDEGDSLIQFQEFERVPALDVCNQACQVERGLFFCDKSGAARFINRHGYLLNRVASVAFGDEGPHELPYSDLKASYDSSRIYNDIRVAVQNINDYEYTPGAYYTAAITASQLAYFVRSLQVSSSAYASAMDAQGFANYAAFRYAEPAFRFDQLIVKPARLPDTLWPICLGLEIGDVISVTRRPPGGGDPTTIVSTVEGIAWEITANREWTVTFSLTPTDTNVWWKLGDSELGTETRTAF